MKKNVSMTVTYQPVQAKEAPIFRFVIFFLMQSIISCIFILNPPEMAGKPIEGMVFGAYLVSVYQIIRNVESDKSDFPFSNPRWAGVAGVIFGLVYAIVFQVGTAYLINHLV